MVVVDAHDVEVHVQHGWTPLMHAVYAGNEEMIKVLLELGVDVSTGREGRVVVGEWLTCGVRAGVDRDHQGEAGCAGWEYGGGRGDGTWCVGGGIVAG